MQLIGLVQVNWIEFYTSVRKPRVILEPFDPPRYFDSSAEIKLMIVRFQSDNGTAFFVGNSKII